MKNIKKDKHVIKTDDRVCINYPSVHPVNFCNTRTIFRRLSIAIPRLLFARVCEINYARICLVFLQTSIEKMQTLDLTKAQKSTRYCSQYFYPDYLESCNTNV